MDTQSTRDARGAGSGMYAENAAVRRSGAFFCRNDSNLRINQSFPRSASFVHANSRVQTEWHLLNVKTVVIASREATKQSLDA